MEDLMQNQQNIMMQMMTGQMQHVPEDVNPPATEEQTPSNLASWPDTQPILDDSVNEFDAQHSRRERVDRPFEEVYAAEHVGVSKNFTLTDASGGRWGAIPQTQTNVGMRTRGLTLNPSLQQPSIGGLM